jgi:hypothetical protein
MPTNIEFLSCLTSWRNDAQLILFELLKLVHEKDSKIKNKLKYRAIFQLLTGCAFSLWRAVFLAENAIRTIPAMEGAKMLLEKVVADNIIGYSDEKNANSWTAGFYVSHIQYRMYHLHKMYGADLAVKKLDKFVKEWDPFKGVSAPQHHDEFFERTIECLNELITALDKLLK